MFQCETITQANWEQQIPSNRSYLKPETKRALSVKKLSIDEYLTPFWYPLIW